MRSYLNVRLSYIFFSVTVMHWNSKGLCNKKKKGGNLEGRTLFVKVVMEGKKLHDLLNRDIPWALSFAVFFSFSLFFLLTSCIFGSISIFLDYVFYVIALWFLTATCKKKFNLRSKAFQARSYLLFFNAGHHVRGVGKKIYKSRKADTYQRHFL